MSMGQGRRVSVTVEEMEMKYDSLPIKASGASPKPRIVTDTNVLVSSFIRERKPHKLILRIDRIDIKLTSSSPLMAELTSVLAEKRISKYITTTDVERFLRCVGRRTTPVKIRSRFKAVKENPKDDVVLNTSHSGEHSTQSPATGN